jgi:hypothetical protein
VFSYFWVRTKYHYQSDWVCSPMIGRSSGTLPTRVQILVLAPFLGFSRIYRRYTLSGKRRSRRRRGAYVSSGISRSFGAQSFGGAYRGRVCVRVFIGVSVRACCERLRFTVYSQKKVSLSKIKERRGAIGVFGNLQICRCS